MQVGSSTLTVSLSPDRPKTTVVDGAARSPRLLNKHDSVFIEGVAWCPSVQDGPVPWPLHRAASFYVVLVIITVCMPTACLHLRALLKA